jgi:branched-chain amino acid aminotransferase
VWVSSKPVATAVLASVDGRISPPGEAMISILDEGLVRGDGAFEVLKLYDGHPFRLEAHLNRLDRSSAAIALAFDRGALESEISAILEAGAAPDGCLRVIVTRGGRRLLTVEEFDPFPPSAAIALVVLTPSEILAGVKSLSYAANMQASRIAAARGGDEAVYVRADGVVLEAPTSSIFWVAADGELRTPALGVGILDSITRDIVIAAMSVNEGAFDRSDLESAREAFLASTNREIQPISAVDGAALPEVGGEATGAASEALAAAVAAERSAVRA